MRILLAIFLAGLRQGVGLTCHSCGKLAEDGSILVECSSPPDVGTAHCKDGEACVTFIDYKRHSEAIVGCFPVNGSIGGLAGDLFHGETCSLMSVGSTSFCMCSTHRCNHHPQHHRTPRAANSLKCPTVTVFGADYADCNGDYGVSGERVSWEESRLVYKHVSKNRYIFWNAGGIGWSIGKKDYLETGSHWHRSGLDTVEPWEAPWEDGVTVECKGQKVPVDCLWSPYSAWSDCSFSCGDGTQLRRRKISSEAQHGGSSCTGLEEEARPCNKGTCPVDCVWGPYGPWSTCSLSCAGGTRTRSRKIRNKPSAGGAPCTGEKLDVEFCNTEACPVGGACCDKVQVGSSGTAKIDQALYMGIYSRISRDFNERAVYRREGRDPLYIYFFTSQRDRLSLWVIGPQLGQFIAGIRNSKNGECVHELGTGWKYASRAGVWEDNDPSLQISCYRDGIQSHQDTPRLHPQPPPDLYDTDDYGQDDQYDSEDIYDDFDSVSEVTTLKPSRKSRQNCVWSKYGPWSECNQSCDGGFQVRIRRILQVAKGDGVKCTGGNRQRRPCNVGKCIAPTLPPTRRPTRRPQTRRPPPQTRRPPPQRRLPSTTTTRRPRPPPRRPPTTRRPPPRQPPTTKRPTERKIQTGVKIENATPGLVKCYVCGSLFSTDAPDCPTFIPRDPGQQKTCDAGEACLFYSWKKSNSETSVIRECFPTSILLGSIDNPVIPSPECYPQPVETDTIQACICTNDLCTGIGGDSGGVQTKAVSVVTPSPPVIASTSAPPVRRRPTTTRPPAERSDPSRVRCHQCGSLFSSASSNPDCPVFDEADPLQNNFCGAGEACLWYSWQKSTTETAIVRECFSTSILLGSIDNPLRTNTYCEPQDVSENSLSNIKACLCDSDLCNSYRDPGEKKPEVFSSKTLEQFSPLPIQSESPRDNQRIPANNQPQFGQSQNNHQEQRDLLNQQNNRERQTPESFRSPDRVQDNQVQTETRDRPKQTFHPDKPGLQCYSCGSLLNPNKKCDKFDTKAPSQVQTCLTDEACLLYAWKKSDTETATLRECFPVRVLLGSIDDPLVPIPDCQQRDITDDGSGSIFACLCNTDFCNNELQGRFDQTSQTQSRKRPGNPGITGPPPTTRRPPPTTRPPRTSPPQTRRPAPPQTQSPPRRKAPSQTTRRPRLSPTTHPFLNQVSSTTRAPAQPVPRPQSKQQYRRDCPNDLVLVDGSCYFFSNNRVGWIEARKMCEQRGTQLLSLETQGKRETILEQVISTGRRRRAEYWLAGNDIEEEGAWEWAKVKSRVGDFGWADEPYTSAEENCLSWTISMPRRKGNSVNDGWQSASCCNNLRYICELKQD